MNQQLRFIKLYYLQRKYKLINSFNKIRIIMNNYHEQNSIIWYIPLEQRINLVKKILPVKIIQLLITSITRKSIYFNFADKWSKLVHFDLVGSNVWNKRSPFELVPALILLNLCDETLDKFIFESVIICGRQWDEMNRWRWCGSKTRYRRTIDTVVSILDKRSITALCIYH